MWLPADLGPENVRILSVTYDAKLFGASEDVTEIGRNLVQILVIRYESLWRAPVVLVGHGFRGLVIKNLVVEVVKRSVTRVSTTLDREAFESCKNFLDKLKGMVFYGVTHAGGMENFTKFFDEKFSVSIKDTAKSGILKNLKEYNRQMGILSTDLMNALPNDIEIFACVGRKDVLVPHASAQRLSRKKYLNVEDANHKTICRPSSKEATNYSRLLIMIIPYFKHMRTWCTSSTMSKTSLLLSRFLSFLL